MTPAVAAAAGLGRPHRRRKPTPITSVLFHAMLFFLLVILCFPSSSSSMVSLARQPANSRAAFTFPFGIVAAAAESAGSSSSLSQCLTFSQIRMPSEIYYAYRDGIPDTESRYFCSASGPAALHCSCEVSYRCNRFTDIYGRNIGRCECCSAWTIVLVVLFLILVVWLLLLSITFLLGNAQERLWWLWAYPSRVHYGYTRVNHPMSASPSGAPFSQSVFTYYRANNFVDVDEGNADLDRSVPNLPSIHSPRNAGDRTFEQEATATTTAVNPLTTGAAPDGQAIRDGVRGEEREHRVGEHQTMANQHPFLRQTITDVRGSPVNVSVAEQQVFPPSPLSMTRLSARNASRRASPNRSHSGERGTFANDGDDDNAAADVAMPPLQLPGPRFVRRRLLH